MFAITYIQTPFITFKPRKKQIAKAICFFQLYSPAASSMHDLRDIAFGSYMRFARWKLQGEYNITVSVANNITFAQQKYHAD